jgi:hypothetical protein
MSYFSLAKGQASARAAFHKSASVGCFRARKQPAAVHVATQLMEIDDVARMVARIWLKLPQSSRRSLQRYSALGING